MNLESQLLVFLFSMSGLIVGITSFILSLVLFIYGKLKLHKIFGLFNLAVAWWGIGAFFIGRSQDAAQALLLFKISHIGIIFIAVFFYHFSSILSGINRRLVIIFAYFQVILFCLLDIGIFGVPFISNVEKISGSFYYLRSNGFVYPIFLIIWGLLVVAALVETYFKFRIEKNSIRKNQLFYTLFWFCVGFSGGLSNFLPAFHIDIIPLGNITIPLYCVTVTYAILRYKLLDIKIAITRAGLFFVVYTFVLGIPVWVGLKLLGMGIWLIPILLMGVFATVGPYIYLYIQKRAEEALLAEQKRYQTTLRQASAGMGRIKDLKKLLNMIVYVLTRAVRLEHALVYIYDLKKRQYLLGASKQRVGNLKFNEYIELNSSLVQHLTKNRLSLIHEEIKQKIEDFKDIELIDIQKVMASLEAELIIPIFVDQNLTAIVVMGKKESGKAYNEDDLSVFTILANQAALAIENAQFYEDMKLTQEQLFQAEKMATIGTMADGLSHQINNRFHALGFIAGDALDTIKICKEKGVPEDLKETFNDLERAFNRVQDNVVQGGEVVQGLLRYTRKGDEGFTAVNFDDVFKSAYEMAQFKIKTSDLKVVRMFDSTAIPKIKGNFTQLQEVFFNLIDNGYDAMIQRKTELKEPGFVPTLKIYVNILENNQAEYVFEDNGAGVKPDDMTKLFTPFFTTKLSSKKGTGLGLYVIKKIIEENHGGQVIMDSVYMTGTKMKIRLPIAFE